MAPSVDFDHLAQLPSLPVIAFTPPGSFCRIFATRYKDPLGVGFGSSRLSDPRDPPEYKILYLAEDFVTAFAEAVLRDRRTGVAGPFVISESELALLQAAEISVAAPLNLFDLSGTNVVRNGIDTDVMQVKSHKDSQRLSLVLHEHDSLIDGVLYDSRITKRRCIGLFERAIPKLSAQKPIPVIATSALDDAFDAFDLALFPAV